MRVFPDSNVWVSAFATHGVCEALVRKLLLHNQQGLLELLTAREVLAETRRILKDKFGASASDLAPVKIAMDTARVVAGKATPANIPDPDDAPIIAAALAAQADLFVTGDKALLDWDAQGALRIVTPRQAWDLLFMG